MWVLTLLLGLLVVLAITAATGYFVAQEFSYMAVDRSRLKARAATGDASAKRALAVTQRLQAAVADAATPKAAEHPLLFRDPANSRRLTQPALAGNETSR